MVFDIILIYVAGVLATMLLIKLNSRLGITPEWYFWETLWFSMSSWAGVLGPLISFIQADPTLSWKDK